MGNSFSGIYKIQSKIKPERIYIGSAVNFKNRCSVHIICLRKNKHNKKLQSHYNEFGENDLEFSILLKCDPKKLIKNEQNFINEYKPYFNISKKAGSTLGINYSDEVKLKMSKAQKGLKHPWRKNLTEESKLKISNSLKGHKVSEETRNKLSKAKIGKPRSEETKRKISQATTGENNPMYGKTKFKLFQNLRS
jgi:group I intron endonuclease